MIVPAIISLDRMVENMSKPKLLQIKPLDAYPIGSIYMSLDSTNPADIFGGVWEQIKDTFLLATGDKYLENMRGGGRKAILIVPRNILLQLRKCQVMMDIFIQMLDHLKAKLQMVILKLVITLIIPLYQEV